MQLHDVLVCQIDKVVGFVDGSHDYVGLGFVPAFDFNTLYVVWEVTWAVLADETPVFNTLRTLPKRQWPIGEIAN